MVLNIGYFVIVISVMHSKVLKAEKWHWYILESLFKYKCDVANK